MRETWYKLENGEIADPAEVYTRDDGRLEHLSGALVEMRGDVPFTWNCDPAEERAKAKDVSPPVTREMDADRQRRPYVRRKGD